MAPAWRKRERAAARGLGLVEPAQPGQRDAQIVVGVGDIGPAIRRRAEELDRGIVGAGLDGRDSGKVEGVNVVGPNGKEQAIQAQRFVRPALIVGVDGHLQAPRAGDVTAACARGARLGGAPLLPPAAALLAVERWRILASHPAPCSSAAISGPRCAR